MRLRVGSQCKRLLVSLVGSFLNTVLKFSSDVDISPGSTSSPLSLPSRSTSFRPEDEYSPLDLQYPPSPPIYPSSWGRESPRGRLDFNPCRNVPGLWFVKIGADASKILEVEFVFEPEFIPGLDPSQTCVSIRFVYTCCGARRAKPTITVPCPNQIDFSLSRKDSLSRAYRPWDRPRSEGKAVVLRKKNTKTMK
jgi:hypothetical protein